MCLISKTEAILSQSIQLKSLLQGNAVLIPNNNPIPEPSYHRLMSKVVQDICTVAELNSGLLRPMLML